MLTGHDSHLSMGSVNLVVIVESVQDLFRHKSGDLNKFHLTSVLAVGAALGGSAYSPTLSALIILIKGVKFLLFLYCYSLRSRNSQVAVLWEDHRNDLFLNAFGDVSP
jgi:hypothetical protein